jgi:rubrerythrin
VKLYLRINTNNPPKIYLNYNKPNIIMDIKGSETEKNLLKAFAGESQARNRYTYFASVAKKEGYEQISAIFTETADNEKEQAKIFFKHLKIWWFPVEITASYPAGKIGTQRKSSRAANGEHEEWGKLYPEFEKVALKKVSRMLQNHSMKLQKLKSNMKKSTENY